MDGTENKEGIEEVFLCWLGRTNESIQTCQIFITNRLSLFLPAGNSLQMICDIKCVLLLFIILQFIYPFIFSPLLGTHYYYSHFMVQFMDMLNLNKTVALTFPKSWFLRGRESVYRWAQECVCGGVWIGLYLYASPRLSISKHYICVLLAFYSAQVV